MSKPRSEEQKVRNAERERARYAADLEVRARKAEYNRAHRADPEAKAKNAERRRAYRADPEVKARKAERQRAHRAGPEVKASQAERDRVRWADPEVKAMKRARYADPETRAKIAERQRAYRADPEVKARRRDTRLRRTYGITLDEYATMIERQSGKCASCERPLQRWDSTGAHAPVVDHCHSTDDARGSVRGILHSSCNVLIGLAQDDAELLRRTARYVERTRTVRPYAPGPEQATLALPGVPSKPRKKGT